MITRYQAEKLTKHKLVNEYEHLKNWHSKNSVQISKLEELIGWADNKESEIKDGMGLHALHYDLMSSLQKLIDEAKGE